MAAKILHNLVVELPGCPPRHYQLLAGSIRIGRVAGNAIVVEEDAVSARHCELRRSAAGYELVDLGSTNGTRVNGEVITSTPYDLREGDVILLGLTAKARFVRVTEIRDAVEDKPSVSGAATMRLERPEINPVAAAMAKAAKDRVKSA